MGRKSILFQLGIEGHIPLAKRFRELFGLDIACVTLTQEMERVLARQNGFSPDRHYSFPTFFKKNIGATEELSLAALRERIHAHEKRWNIPSIVTFYYFDRYFRYVRDHATVLRHVLLYMDFAAHILEREDIAWNKGNLTTLFGLVMQSACLARGIPSLKHRAACISGRIEFMDEASNGHLRGWRSVYRALTLDSNTVAPETVDEARAWLRAFRQRPNRPRYSEKNSVAEFDLAKFVRLLWQGVAVRFDPEYWAVLFGCPLDRRLGFRAPFGDAFLKDFLLREARAFGLRRSRWCREAVDLDQPFVYLPLHFTPEISTLTHGLRYEDQRLLVSNLAKYLPSGLVLYVKEHTSMPGRRPMRFYRDVAEHFNVRLIDPRVSTFDLIRKAKAVATVTGTAGWEAFVFGKPVIVLGNVFFNEFPNVLHLNIDDDTAERIGNYLDNFEPNDREIERAVTAYFDTTYRAETGDIGVDVTDDEAAENARRLADAFHDQLTRFPLNRSRGPVIAASDGGE